MSRFVDWLVHQTDRDDLVGTIAKEVACDAARSGKTVSETLKDRFGGVSEDHLKRDYLLARALAEFKKGFGGGTADPIYKDGPEENFETARQLNAIALFHGVKMGKIPLEEKAPLEETSFEFVTLQGFRCYTTIKPRVKRDPILRTWFNIRDCDVKTLNEIEDSELLNHCDAMVEMFFVRDGSPHIFISDEPLYWIYKPECLKGLQGLFSGYADKFKEPDSGEGGPLWLKY